MHTTRLNQARLKLADFASTSVSLKTRDCAVMVGGVLAAKSATMKRNETSKPLDLMQ